MIIPCYGMAETVLATTLCQNKNPTTDTSFGRVRWTTYDGRRVVSCGVPVDGVSLRVNGVAGEAGAIEVHGSSVMAGYLTTRGLDAPPAGWHDTGDVGLLIDDELYVVGRTKEMLIVRGRNIPPYDIERAIEEHPLVSAGASAVFSYQGEVTEQVVAVVETKAKPGEWQGIQSEVGAAVRQAFGLSLTDVVVVPRGRIPRTTSGKRQRQALRGAYLSGHLTQR